MRAKKLLALALAGALSASMLAGCSRTIIEHQFHTDTEYIETIIENSDMNGAEKLTGWFLAHEITPAIQLEADIGTFIPDNKQEQIDLLISLYDFSTKPITEKTISLLYEYTFDKEAELNELQEFEAQLIRFIKCDSASDLTSAWLIYANSVYEALIKYVDEWDWDSIGGRIERVEMGGKIVNCSVDPNSPPQYYAQFGLKFGLKISYNDSSQNGGPR